MTQAERQLNRRDYAVLWDVDGVIVDSAEQHQRSWERLAEENGFTYSDERFWETFGRRNADVIPLMFGPISPAERVARLADRKEELYRELLAMGATPLPGARELMAALHAAGYHQALGSSAPSKNIELVVKVLDIGRYLDGMVSGEEVARGKPAPDIYLAAAQQIGILPHHCLVIEDATAGIEAAHAASMRCLAVRRPGVADAPGLEYADYLVTSLAQVSVADVEHLLLTA
ncbi:MAG: HAD family hydrolase [Ktedonobacterales bacterium]